MDFKINQIVRVLHTVRGSDGEYGIATLWEGMLRGTATIVKESLPLGMPSLTTCYIVELPEGYYDPKGGFVKYVIVHEDNICEV